MPMDLRIQEHASIATYTTLKLGGAPDFLVTLSDTSPDTLHKLWAFMKEKNAQLFFLGGGSNIVCTDEQIKYCVVKIETKGIKTLEEADSTVTVQVEAGHVWDDFVAWAVERGYSGVEALSAIPGTVGAAPVQNIGAYGAEVKDTIKEVHAFDFEIDSEQGREKVFSNADCKFGYRDSIFKKFRRGRMLITSVVFTLSKHEPKIPTYAGVEQALVVAEGKNLLEKIRNAITTIRWSKLPRPDQIPNVGSFFKNAIITKTVADALKISHPDLRLFMLSENEYKVPTGWLIENVGMKGVSDETGKVSTYEKNALVLINNGVSTKALLHFAHEIQQKIKAEFNIDIEIEPEILG